MLGMATFLCDRKQFYTKILSIISMQIETDQNEIKVLAMPNSTLGCSQGAADAHGPQDQVTVRPWLGFGYKY